MQSIDSETIKSRLILFIKSLSIGQGAFERQVGLSNGYVNNIRMSIQPDKLQKITLQYPGLNAGWLMTGEGEMLKKALPPTDHKDELIASQQRTIEELTSIIKNLTNK